MAFKLQVIDQVEKVSSPTIKHKNTLVFKGELQF